MVSEDDFVPKPPELKFRNLEQLSVAALEAYITELESEITRIRAEIAKRGGARAAAEAFFS